MHSAHSRAHEFVLWLRPALCPIHRFTIPISFCVCVCGYYLYGRCVHFDRAHGMTIYLFGVFNVTWRQRRTEREQRRRQPNRAKRQRNTWEIKFKPVNCRIQCGKIDFKLLSQSSYNKDVVDKCIENNNILLHIQDASTGRGKRSRTMRHMFGFASSNYFFASVMWISQINWNAGRRKAMGLTDRELNSFSDAIIGAPLAVWLVMIISRKLLFLCFALHTLLLGKYTI